MRTARIQGSAPATRLLVAGAVTFGVLLAASACAPTTPDRDTWGDRGRESLEQAADEMTTLQLMLRLRMDGRLPQAWCRTTALDSEKLTATAAQSFSDLQPPSGEDHAASDVADALQGAVTAATAVRIAVVARSATGPAGAQVAHAVAALTKVEAELP